jgi:L-iditol 2-dehydrogenase
MLAAVIEKPGELRVREVPVPEIDDTECLVEILACSICNSTDRKLLDGHFRYCGPGAYPGIVGHEGVGRVVKCGSRVESFEEGDLVLRPGARYDQGEEGAVGSLWGGMAQFGKIKDPVHGGNRMHQIVPPEMDPLDATMLITLKETLSWLQRWGVQRGESVLVMGSGPVGVSFGFFAKLLGCGPVLVMGRRDEPLARAMALGVDAVVNSSRQDMAEVVQYWTGGRGVDRVIEAVGDDSLVEQGLSVMATGGRLGIYGISPTREPGDMERRAVDIGKGRDEWLVEFFGPQEWAPHEHLLWLVRQGVVRLRDYYTHVVPLKDAQRGFDLLESREAFKVVVAM